MRIPNPVLIRAPAARWSIYLLAIVFVAYHFGPALLYAGPGNGFDLDGALVPQADIHPGGPPRDGIPAIDRPRFVDAGQADFLAPGDRVLGIDRHGIRRAYPVRILNYHEIVNDRFGDEAVVVTYCPLCGTGMAFLARVQGRPRSFGVSGLLYKSDMLLYDRETQSLWSQLRRQAISGPSRGARLQQIVLDHTSWADWSRRFPDTQVLSTHTGYRRDYSVSPYPGYARSEALYFPVGAIDRRYHPKERVVGVTLNGVHKAYPFAELSRMRAPLRDQVAGRDIRVVFDAQHRTGRVLGQDGEVLPSTIAYWFAWTAFHPDTLVWRAPGHP